MFIPPWTHDHMLFQGFTAAAVRLWLSGSSLVLKMKAQDSSGHKTASQSLGASENGNCVKIAVILKQFVQTVC